MFPRVSALVRPFTRALTFSTHSAMKAGDVPQYLIKTHGVHRTGILRDVARVLAERQISIAATQKIALGTEYAMVLHVHHPEGAGMDDSICDEVRRTLGASSEVRVKPLDHASLQQYLGLGPVERRPALNDRSCFCPIRAWNSPKIDPVVLGRRRLSMECPQRPGLIMAVTELLGVEGCQVKKMETSTSVRDGVVMFHMEATVQIPRGHEVDSLTSKLRGIQAANKGLELKFDLPKDQANVGL